MSSTQRRIVSTVFLAAIAIAFGAAAQEGETAAVAGVETATPERNWTLRFGLMAVDTSGDTAVSAEPGAVNVHLSGGGGVFVSFERRMTPLLGLEMGLLAMGADMNISSGAGSKHHSWGSSVDTLAMGSMTVGLNFHFVDSGPVDVYAGPLVAFNQYSGVSVRSGYHDGWWEEDDEWTSARVRSDSEVTWGAKAGVDFLLGQKQRWSVGCSLTYMDATYDFERESEPGSTAISLDPLMLSFAAGFRF